LIAGVLLVAAVTHLLTGGRPSGPASASTSFVGSYQARALTAELAARDATQLSRAASRPTVLVTTHARPVTKAERRLVSQYRLLRRAADNAEKYAKRLSSHEWVYPTSNFSITELFGVPGRHWISGYHTGIDFAAAYGTPVVAVGNGTVVSTGWDGPYGNQIRLRLPNGDEVWYNHLSSIEVTPGQAVLKGQSLGRVGDTGNAFGYHLHLEYRLASDLSQPVDPAPFFAAHRLPLE
jgi:murein DD-endopeptidase MepM/ murein hydrolase activator NlpD